MARPLPFILAALVLLAVAWRIFLAPGPDDDGVRSEGPSLPEQLIALEGPDPEVAASGVEEFRVEDLKAHIGYLASEELEGRGSGSEGARKAARYVAEQFESYGLEPLSEEHGFLVPFHVRKEECFNVVAVLEGTDPALADEWLVLGAHHDHAGLGQGALGGMGFPGEVHNGADDNASGTAAVLELAQNLAAHPLAHPVIFCTFSAEERGLLGSKALVKSGLLPNDNIRAMLNLDMVGRLTDDYLFVGGMGTADEFHTLLDPVLEASGLDLEVSDLGEAPSDNTSFFHAGIPSLFLFTHVHRDYHMPSDDAHLINYEGEVRVIQLARNILETLDGHPESLTFQDVEGMGMPRDFNDRMMEHYVRIAERRAKKGRLGIRPGSYTESGLELVSVRESSAAAKAGIQGSDIVVAIDGRKILTSKDIRRALAGKLKGTEVAIILGRPEGEVEITAVLD